MRTLHILLTVSTNPKDGVYSLIQIVQDKTTSTASSLKKSGLNYENGRLSVKTDRVAPTHQEYIASTQRAFEKGGEVFKQNPSAFKMGAPEGKSSSVDSTPYVPLDIVEVKLMSSDKKGFKRGKKLD